MHRHAELLLITCVCSMPCATPSEVLRLKNPPPLCSVWSRWRWRALGNAVKTWSRHKSEWLCTFLPLSFNKVKKCKSVLISLIIQWFFFLDPLLTLLASLEIATLIWSLYLIIFGNPLSFFPLTFTVWFHATSSGSRERKFESCEEAGKQSLQSCWSQQAKSSEGSLSL